MVPRVEDFVAQAGDSGAERKLAGVLRAQPEEDRLQFIQQLIAAGQPKCFRAALRLVKSSLHQRESLLKILDQGLRQADASVISDWIEAVVAGLGFKRVVGVLAERVESNPEAVIKARYWLPKWVPSGNESALEAVHALDRLIAEKIKDDPRLQAWFRSVQGLPREQEAESRESGNGQNSPRGLPPILCPRCTAVLLPWAESTREQTCPLCGHRIAR